MTAREMIEQEFSGKLGPQSMFEPDGNIRPGVVFAAERVIERLRAALAEQTSRGNHHEERATEYQALLRECEPWISWHYDNGADLSKRIRAALGEVRP